MIKCPSCSFENPEDGKFCMGCGKALAPPPAPAPGADGPPRFCTECGAKIPADSKFCTACGQAFGTPGPGASASTAGGAGAPLPGQGGDAAAYLSELDARLAQSGFEPVEAPAILGLDRFLRRKKFELAQIGVVTVVCGVKALAQPATPAYVKDFSKAVFDAAVSKKGFFARNALQQLLVYPVLVVPSVEAGVAEFLAGHWPKHWMAFEFTVVVSLGTKEALMHRSTPVWQALSHTGFKKQAESLFAF